MATNTGVLANSKPAANTETTIFKNDVKSSTTGTLVASCDGTGTDTYEVSLRPYDQELTLNAATYKLHRGDVITNVKWTLSASIPLEDALPGTKFTSTDGEKCAYLLDVVDPAVTTYLTKYKDLIAFTLENVSDGSSSAEPDYANGETVTNGAGVSGVVYEYVPGEDDAGVVWIGDVSGGSFAEGNVLTGGSSTTVGTVSTGGIAAAAGKLVFNDGAGGAVYQYYLQEQPQLLTDRTYKFDVADNSMTGKVLQFSTTAGGTNNGGTEWTAGKTVSGTPGQAGAYVQYDLSTSEPVSNWYPHDQADANYADGDQFFTMTNQFVYNEIWVYSQEEEDGIGVVSDWVTTNQFLYRNATYTINAIAGDSYSTILSHSGTKTTVVNGPGSALWVGSDTFIEAPRQVSASKNTATISSVSNDSDADLYIQADSISANTSELNKGIILGPGQSIKVKATNGYVTFSLDAFQDTVAEYTTTLYQRSGDYQTDGGDGGE